MEKGNIDIVEKQFQYYFFIYILNTYIISISILKWHFGIIIATQ